MVAQTLQYDVAQGGTVMGLTIDDDQFIVGDARKSVERRQFLFGFDAHVVLWVEGAGPFDVYRAWNMAAALCA